MHNLQFNINFNGDASMLIVQKFGGTSVANIERIKNVARRSANEVKKGNSVIVVVSAMAGETDNLINLAHQVNPAPSGREMDILLSSGERITCALTAMAIQSLGQKAIAFTGRQLGIYTDSVHTRAKIKYINDERAKKVLNEGNIVVVAGFQGVSKENQDVTTLGKGGSDLSAVAIACAMKTDLCEIYTDVDGVYTSDPNIVKDAHKIDRISYEEMLELASLGAKVLQTRSVEVAAKFNVPLMVRSSFNYKKGTLITRKDKDMEKVLVSAIAHDKNQSRITVKDAYNKPGIAAKIFSAIADRNIVVDMISQNIVKGDKRARLSKTVFGDLVGPICESGDFLACDKELPLLNSGDLFAVMSAGAYGVSMSSNYNARPRAAEVLVDGSRIKLIRRRESYYDLIRHC